MNTVTLENNLRRFEILFKYPLGSCVVWRYARFL